MKQARQPSELELQVLSVLWRIGPATVRQVMRAIPDGRVRAYTSVLSVMQVMEKKGLLKHVSEGNVHVYRPAVAQSKVLGGVLRRLVQHVFGGSPAAAMQQLLEDAPLSEHELAEMRNLLNHHSARPPNLSKHSRGQSSSRTTTKER